MKRHLFNLLSAISLLLFVATLTLLIYSAFGFMYVGIGASPPRAHWELGSTRGYLYCIRVVHPPGYPERTGWHMGNGLAPGPVSWSWRFGGFDVQHKASPSARVDFRQFVVPHYFAMFLLGVLPALWWRAAVRRESRAVDSGVDGQRASAHHSSS